VSTTARRFPARGPVLMFREGRDVATGIRRLREAAGLSQLELARRLDCNIMWLRQREWGSLRMTRSEAERVAAALGTDYPGLLAAGSDNGGEDDA
jgi:transcriptional regulator with XRE-family HTH domain